MIRRHIGPMLSVAFTGLLLTGCGFVTTSGEPFRVSEPHASNTLAGQVFGMLAGEFTPVSIDLRHFSENKMLHKYWGGKLLAVALIPHYVIQTFVKPDMILPMSSYTRALQPGGYYPSVWSNGMENGIRYRFGGDVKVSEMIYNRSLFIRAGITVPPATWAGLAKDLKRLRGMSAVPFEFAPQASDIEAAFISNGGILPNQSGVVHAFDNLAGETTFQYFRALYAEHLMTLSTDAQMINAIATGQTAIISASSPMYLDAAQQAQLHRISLGAFPYPAGRSGHTANVERGLQFAMFAHHSPQTQHEEWQFIQWFDSPKEQAIWASKTGYGPVTANAAPLIPSQTLKKDPGLRVTLNALSSPTTVTNPGVSGYGQVEMALSQEFTKAIQGNLSVNQALQAVDVAVHRKL